MNLTKLVFYLFMVMIPAVPVAEAGALQSLLEQHPDYDQHDLIVVDISSQVLRWFHDGKLKRQYPVSTSRYGIGSKAGSNRTPLGLHYIRRKIGAGAESGTIFRARKSTGRKASIEHRPIVTGDDYVTSRIMWLSGLEAGKNRGKDVDSYSRYIYIHGTHEEGLIGQPASHGCIRMRNQDVIELFKNIRSRTLVRIQK